MRKKLICKCSAFALCVALLCSVLCLTSCSKKPKVEDVYDRFVYLIEESRELNTIFFGAGVPVYEQGSLISDRREIYFGYTKSNFDIVMENSKYDSIESIKKKAESVYSTNYLNAIYETAFDGVLYDGGSFLRFYSEGDTFYQNAGINIYELENRIYDYSTMKIVKPSNEERVNVQIESYVASNPDARRTITIAFQNENGDWYLDGPTY